MDKALYILAGYDDATEARLSGIQNALYDAGFVGTQTKDIPMHATLGSFPAETESELVGLLKSLSGTVESFEVAFNHIGIFGGSRVLFIAPDASHELLNLKERFGSSNGWTPHTTMLIDEPDVVQSALPLVMREFEPFRGKVTTLYLYEFQPPRHILTVELKEGGSPMNLDKLRLVKLEPKYRRHLTEMMDEWLAVESDITPHAIVRSDYHDFDSYLEKLPLHDAAKGHVPDSTFFCLDEERDIFVGAVNIRHYLSDRLLQFGGHIGDGVRPSERRKGVATRMIALALDECRNLGIERVLMTCDKPNIGSAKSIQRNGGVLENEVEHEGEIVQRYWIELK